VNDHRPEPPYTDFKAGELTPWQDLSRKVKELEATLAAFNILPWQELTETVTMQSRGLKSVEKDVKIFSDGLLQQTTNLQMLDRGLRTLEGSVASLAVHVDNTLRELDSKVDALEFMRGWIQGQVDRLTTRDQQLTATIEGVDAHLENLEHEWRVLSEGVEICERRDEQLSDMIQGIGGTTQRLDHQITELHSTFQASIDKLDAKFDEYMQYVRNTSHTTIAQGTRIAQLETLAGQQRTMIETALRGLKEVQETFPEKFS
jgi:chromosome segregation ATPase